MVMGSWQASRSVSGWPDSTLAMNPFILPPFMSARASTAICGPPAFESAWLWYGFWQSCAIGSGTHGTLPG